MASATATVTARVLGGGGGVRTGTTRNTARCGGVEGISSSRRGLLLGGSSAAAAAAAILSTPSAARAISGAKGTPVGEFMPDAGEGFVKFVPDGNETPGLRAGMVSTYGFELPGEWKQLQVANILSGNYCQPRCSEPWVEVQFGGKEGKATVWICPMEKLTFASQGGKSIDEIGTLDSIIASLGPYVTGNTLDVDEEVVTKIDRDQSGQMFYDYEIFSPYSLNGEHGLATISARGDSVLMLAISATDNQWDKYEDKLKRMATSFAV